MIWALLIVLSAAALLVLLWPLIRRMPQSANISNNDLTVYSHQLSDLENDIARGVVEEEEATDIRLEIQRRV